MSFRAAREVEDFGLYRADDGEKPGEAEMDCLEARPLSLAVLPLAGEAQGGRAGGLMWTPFFRPGVKVVKEACSIRRFIFHCLDFQQALTI